MKQIVEIIDRKAAIDAYNRLEPVAQSIAQAHGLMPFECGAPECLRLRALASCINIGRNERALALDGMPLYQITDFEVGSGRYALGNICIKASDFEGATVENNILTVTFKDGVQEYFEFVEEADAYRFVKNNTAGIKIPFIHSN